MAFGSGAGQSETCDSHTIEVSKWTFSKTPFFLSSRKRKIRERIGDKSPVGFFVPATQLASSLRRLCYLICEFRKRASGASFLSESTDIPAQVSRALGRLSEITVWREAKGTQTVRGLWSRLAWRGRGDQQVSNLPT